MKNQENKKREIPLENKPLLTIKEVAEIINCNVSFVYKLNEAKVIKMMKLGSLKMRRIELDRFLEQIEGMDYTDPFNPKRLS